MRKEVCVCEKPFGKLTLEAFLFLLATLDVVVVELAAEQEAELGVALLLVLRHLFEFGSIAGDKFGQFVDYDELLIS